MVKQIKSKHVFFNKTEISSLFNNNLNIAKEEMKETEYRTILTRPKKTF